MGKRIARGVTLIEMMFVLTILGVIVTIATPNLGPVIHRNELAAAVEQVALFADRARRMAFHGSRCVILKPKKVYGSYSPNAPGDGSEYLFYSDELHLQMRRHGDCFTEPGKPLVDLGMLNLGDQASFVPDLDPDHWREIYAGNKRPEVTMKTDTDIMLQVQSVVNANTTWKPQHGIVFRPNGRIRGNGNRAIFDDGARVLVRHKKVKDRIYEVRVTATGRTCVVAHFHLKAPPRLEVPVSCGAGFDGLACSSAEGPEPILIFGLTLLALRRNRRQRRQR